MRECVATGLKCTCPRYEEKWMPVKRRRKQKHWKGGMNRTGSDSEIDVRG